MIKKILKSTVIWVLTLEARLVLKKYSPKIIAITGSVGKTSTKDAIYAAISNSFNVRRSPKSFNAQVGLPLTILNLSNAWSNPFLWIKNMCKGAKLLFVQDVEFPEILILEVGADMPGDIERVTKWLTPDIVVFTRLGSVPVHVEHFASPKDVALDKSYLVRALQNEGVLLVNSDDEDVVKMRKYTKGRVVTFGQGDRAHIRGSNIRVDYDEGTPSGVSFKLDYDGRSMPVQLTHVLGRHHVYAALAALAVGYELGVNMVDLLEGVRAYTPPPGRLRLIEGVNGSSIIDDTYNSSPVAAHAALDTLADIDSQGEKIALIGDMLELGKYTKSEHRKLGQHAAKVCTQLALVGKYSEYVKQGAIESGLSEDAITIYDTSEAAGTHLKDILLEHDVILVKGSQGVRLERAVLAMMQDLSTSESLLVRQDTEWLKR